MVSQEMLEAGRVRSAIREVFEYGRARALLIGEENVFDFSLGNPSVPPPQEVTAAFLDILENCDPTAVHGYTSAPGSNDAREAIAANLNRRYGTRFSRRNFYLTCGAAAALNAVFRAVTLNAESELVVIAPYFPEYACYAKSVGATLVVVESDKASFQIDFKKLSAALTERTQAVVINSPNNPSGVVYSEETLRALAALLQNKSEQFGHPIYLVADEPYRELNYTGVSLPFITTLYACAIVTYSYSKSLSLPGDRMGYVLVADEMPDFDDVCNAIAGAARMQGYVCAPAILQHVIARCAKNDIMPDLSSYLRNRDLLYGGLTEIGYRCVPPDGAFYLFVQSPDGDGDALAELAKSEDILIVSGRGFGCPDYVRISYCVDYETIRRALPGFRRLYELAKKI